MPDGSVAFERGCPQGNASEHVEEILRGARLSEGFVAITSGHRVLFFQTAFPRDGHQRPHNVLLNQWR